MKLEVVVVPVADVDRAKRFHESLGWRLGADFVVGQDLGVVQLTPTGSECSIIIGNGITSAVPGSVEALQLTVFDIEAAGRATASSALWDTALTCDTAARPEPRPVELGQPDDACHVTSGALA